MADVSVQIPGLERLEKKLAKLPKATQDEALNQVGKYMMSEKVLGWYPKARYITRKSAYGVTFFTAKQRRWFFWALRNGNIDVPYRRTMQLRRGWRVTGTGDTRRLTNSRPGAQFVIGNRTQSRHEAKVGWKTLSRLVKDNARGIQRTINGALARAFKRAGFDK